MSPRVELDLSMRSGADLVARCAGSGSKWPGTPLAVGLESVPDERWET